MEQALRNEQHEYKDLLLGGDIDVVDSYYNLVQKSSAFMEYAVKNFMFEYLMMIDDDVFLKVDDLVAGLRARDDEERKGRFYAGQVWSVQYSKKIKPSREEKHRNYVSEVRA